jgi:hypothetical protein
MNKSSVITACFKLYNGYSVSAFAIALREGLASCIARPVKATSIPSTLRFAMKRTNSF